MKILGGIKLKMYKPSETEYGSLAVQRSAYKQLTGIVLESNKFVFRGTPISLYF